jgi:hypothetical protein
MTMHPLAPWNCRCVSLPVTNLCPEDTMGLPLLARTEGLLQAMVGSGLCYFRGSFLPYSMLYAWGLIRDWRSTWWNPVNSGEDLRYRVLVSKASSPFSLLPRLPWLRWTQVPAETRDYHNSNPRPHTKNQVRTP